MSARSRRWIVPEVVRLPRVLLALDEVRDGLVLERLVLGRARLWELALLRGVGLLRAREQLLEGAPGDGRAVDHGDGVGRDLVGVAAAGGDEGHGG